MKIKIVKMKPIYLAGPIFGSADSECKIWRTAIRQLIPHVIDPMDRDYRGKEYLHTREIVEQDKADIDRCGAVLANLTRVSVGTSMEILYAFERGIPVVARVPLDIKVSPWIQYHATVVEHFDQALEILKQMGKI